MNTPENPQGFHSTVYDFEKAKSLRDEIAIAALQGMLSASFMKTMIYTPEERAHHAYQYADAMLAERAKVGERIEAPRHEGTCRIIGGKLGSA